MRLADSAREEKIAPSEARYPLPECVVPPLESAEVFTSLPSMRGAFWPSWLSIPDEVARHLLVTDVKVGKNSQNVSGGCVPASLFAESRVPPVGSRLLLDTMVTAHLELRVSITNTSDEPVRLSGQVLGTHDDSGASLGLLLLGLGHNLVAPGKFRLSVQPQVTISPVRLFVPDHLLQHFTVLSVSCRSYSHGCKTSRGVESCDGGQPPSSVPTTSLVPSNLRGPGEVRLVPLPTVRASDFLDLVLVNESREARWFSGAVLGTGEPT